MSDATSVGKQKILFPYRNVYSLMRPGEWDYFTMKSFPWVMGKELARL